MIEDQLRDPGTLDRWECRTCQLCSLPQWVLRITATIALAAPDPCLGLLQGVEYACCGHGETRRAYVTFPGYAAAKWYDKEELLIDGEEALDWFRDRRVGPEFLT